MAVIHATFRRATASSSLAAVIREQGTTTALELSGECDLAAMPKFRCAITDALGREPAHLVLDLAQLCFMDSSGVHVVVELAHRCAAQDTRLVICPGSPQVRRLFDLCGVGARLPFFETLDETA